MVKTLVFVVLLSLLVILPGGLAETARALPSASCPEGTLGFPGTADCYPIVDRRGEFGNTGVSLPPRTPPDRPDRGPGEFGPAGGGLDFAGVTYDQGSVDASEGALLMTGMSVYPTGLGAPPSGGYVYFTANNRTDLFLEILAVYTDGAQYLAVYDASCNPGEGVATETCDVPNNGYQIIELMSESTCYFVKQQDGQGRWHDMLNYANFGVLFDESTNPDVWLNEAQWFNQCTQTWDTVYSRQFQHNAENCAMTGCSWWGPILEPRIAPITSPIRELEYVNSTIFLFKGGQPFGPLVPPWTEFINPQPPLQLLHRTPNHTWATGNLFDADGDSDLDSADNCLSWHNPAQNLPDWTISPSADLDCDGFGRVNEQFVGTWEADQCAKTAVADDEVKDAWPPDFNDNRFVNSADVGRFVPVLNSSAPGPPYSQRYDLDANGTINSIDVGKMVPFLNKSCS